MTKSDREKVSGRQEGRKVELESLTDQNISGEFKVVDSENNVENLPEKILQAVLYPGNSRVSKVVLESTEDNKKLTVVVNLDEGEAKLVNRKV